MGVSFLEVSRVKVGYYVFGSADAPSPALKGREPSATSGKLISITKNAYVFEGDSVASVALLTTD
jgi:hypothetical protein